MQERLNLVAFVHPYDADGKVATSGLLLAIQVRLRVLHREPALGQRGASADPDVDRAVRLAVAIVQQERVGRHESRLRGGLDGVEGDLTGCVGEAEESGRLNVKIFCVRGGYGFQSKLGEEPADPLATFV